KPLHAFIVAVGSKRARASERPGDVGLSYWRRTRRASSAVQFSTTLRFCRAIPSPFLTNRNRCPSRDTSNSPLKLRIKATPPTVGGRLNRRLGLEKENVDPACTSTTATAGSLCLGLSTKYN